jgi:lysophospholipase L1-like esterase
MKKNDSTNQTNSFLLYFITLLLSFFFIAVGAELYVRLVADNGMNYTLEMWKYARQAKQISSDPRIGHEHIPNARGHFMGYDVFINSQGLRDKEYTFEKPKNTTRILMLGDSLAFGWGVAQDQTSSKILETLLNQNGNHFYEVINSGVGNYNSDMEIGYFLKKGYLWNPDIVILNYFINDAEPTPKYGGNFFSEHFYSYVYFGGVLDTFLRRFFGKTDYKTYYSNLYEETAPGWIQTQKAFGELSSYCKSKHIKLILAHQPELRELHSYPFEFVTKKIETMSKNNEVPFIDLMDFVKNEPEESLWVSKPDPHPNAKACKLFAQGLYKILRQNSLAPMQ